MQPQFEPIQAPEQIAILLATIAGFLDEIPLDEVASVKKNIIETFSERLPELHKRIQSSEKLTDEDRDMLLNMIRSLLKVEK